MYGSLVYVSQHVMMLGLRDGPEVQSYRLYVVTVGVSLQYTCTEFEVLVEAALELQASSLQQSLVQASKEIHTVAGIYSRSS